MVRTHRSSLLLQFWKETEKVLLWLEKTTKSSNFVCCCVLGLTQLDKFCSHLAAWKGRERFYLLPNLFLSSGSVLDSDCCRGTMAECFFWTEILWKALLLHLSLSTRIQDSLCIHSHTRTCANTRTYASLAATFSHTRKLKKLQALTFSFFIFCFHSLILKYFYLFSSLSLRFHLRLWMHAQTYTHTRTHTHTLPSTVSYTLIFFETHTHTHARTHTHPSSSQTHTRMVFSSS